MNTVNSLDRFLVLLQSSASASAGSTNSASTGQSSHEQIPSSEERLPAQGNEENIECMPLYLALDTDKGHASVDGHKYSCGEIEETKQRKKKQKKYQQKFREKWLEIKGFRPWLKRAPPPYANLAYCVACETVLRGAINHLRRHFASRMHLKRVKSLEEKSSVEATFQKESTVQVDVEDDEMMVDMYCVESPSAMEESIGFIGAGNMAQALAGGFVKSGFVSADKIWASAPSDKNLKIMKEKGFNTTNNNIEVVDSCNVVFLSVKPHFAEDVLKSISSSVKSSHIIVSIMASITLEMLENSLPKYTRIIRTMPNCPALVGCGVTTYTKGRFATEEDRVLIGELMRSVGICEEVPEKLISVATGLAGSGPAYVYLMMQAMSDGAVKMGLPRHLATKFALHTFAGAAQMALDSGKHLSVLQEETASPGGTTIHGLHQLELGGVRGALMNAVEAATIRNHQKC